MVHQSGVFFLATLVLILAGCAQESHLREPVGLAELGANRELRINGRAFFPLMNFYQTPASFANAEAMGLNAYFMPGAKPSPKEYLDALWEKRLYGFVPFAQDAVGHPALLGWIQPHEPEKAFLLKGKTEMSPQKMLESYAAMKRAATTRIVALDFSPEFMADKDVAKEFSDEQKRKVYPEYAKAADLVTYNVYPIWGHNRPEKIDWVAEAAAELRQLVGHDKPFFAMIETTTGWRKIDPKEQKPLTVEDIRAEVWMAVIRGATGIIYFSHQFKPKFSEHGLDAQRHAAIKAINDQITRLSPAILSADAADQPTITIEGGLAAQCLAKKTSDGLVIFAQNIDMQRRGGKAVITCKGLERGTKIEVVDENRTITAAEGEFSDQFDKLAVHIYRIVK
jgi:glycosyl hydrolase family 42 (putative beta-galactosidase)